MNTEKLLSYVAYLDQQAPSFDISNNSIVLVEDDGIEFLIGDDAATINPEGGRITGGTIQDKHYQRLMKGLLAKGLGAGDFDIAIGMSAATNFIQKFRENRGVNYLNGSDYDTLKELVSDIRFRVGRTDSKIQTCRVKLKEDFQIPVLYETEAVTKVIPDYAHTYMLLQVGGGDWQSLIVTDDNIQQTTHARVSGIKNAVERLAKILNIQTRDALQAWATTTKPSSNISGKWESCEKEKRLAAKGYIIEQLPKLLASTEGFAHRIKALVISGGATHDEIFIDELKKELPTNFTLYTVKDMEIIEPKSDKIMDPSFTCAFGILASGCSVALDIGNSHLKGVFDVK